MAAPIFRSTNCPSSSTCSAAICPSSARAPRSQSEVEQYQRWQRRRLRMRPGLTCLWAVEGRDAVDFENWMRLDMEYIDNWSLSLDARIILRTIPQVASRAAPVKSGSSAETHKQKFSTTVRSSGRALRKSRSASNLRRKPPLQLRFLKTSTQ